MEVAVRASRSSRSSSGQGDSLRKTWSRAWPCRRRGGCGGIAVAGELDVATGLDRPPAVGASGGDGAFPVAEGEAELLGGAQGLHGEVEGRGAGAWQRQAPAGAIADVAGRADPGAGGGE